MYRAFLVHFPADPNISVISCTFPSGSQRNQAFLVHFPQSTEFTMIEKNVTEILFKNIMMFSLLLSIELCYF
jgi:hypothetical protein